MSAANEAWEVGQAGKTLSFVSQFGKALALVSDLYIRAYHRYSG